MFRWSSVDRVASTAGPAHQRRDLRPVLVRQIRRVALRLPSNLGHSAAAPLGPHPKRESRHGPQGNLEASVRSGGTGGARGPDVGPHCKPD
jgi:hypothetical protein